MIEKIFSKYVWFGLALTLPFFMFDYFRLENPALGLKIPIPMFILIGVMFLNVIKSLRSKKGLVNPFYKIGYLFSALLVFFLGWHIISILLFDGDLLALKAIVKLVVGYFCMIGIVIYFPKEKNILEKFWIISIWVSAVIVAAFFYRYAFVFKASSLSTNWEMETRQGRNQLTWFLIFILPFAISHMWRSSYKLFSGLPVLVLFVSLFYSGSRGALISIAGAILFIIIIKVHHEGVQSFVNIPILILLIGGIGGYSWWLMTEMIENPEAVMRFETLNPEKISELKSEGRWELIQISLQAFYSSPLLGIGLGNSIMKDQVHHYATHNDYIKLMAELGIPGLMVFLGILISLFIRAAPKKPGKSEQIPWVFIGGYGSLFGVSTSLIIINAYESSLLWIFIGLVMVGKEIEMKENNPEYFQSKHLTPVGKSYYGKIFS